MSDLETKHEGEEGKEVKKRKRSKGRKISTFCRRIKKVVDFEHYLEYLDIAKSLCSFRTDDNGFLCQPITESLRRSYIYKFFECTEKRNKKRKMVNALTSFTFFYLSYMSKQDYYSNMFLYAMKRCIPVYKIPEKIYIRGVTCDLYERYSPSRIFDFNAMYLVLDFYDSDIKVKEKCTKEEKDKLYEASDFSHYTFLYEGLYVYIKISFEDEIYFISGYLSSTGAYKVVENWELFDKNFSMLRPRISTGRYVQISNKVHGFFIRNGRYYMDGGNIINLLCRI